MQIIGLKYFVADILNCVDYFGTFDNAYRNMTLKFV